jgi:glutathione S-transferase
MILIGQYDSPFVRRVGIALKLHALPFEHRPWSVWGDADKIAEYNPLRRVPTLILGDGSVLVESFSILQALDEIVGPARTLWPVPGPARHDAFRLAALATGICDKAVVLLYSSLDFMTPSGSWKTRCLTQIRETFSLLEHERAQRSTRFLFGDALTHADIACACAIRFALDSQLGLFDTSAFPALNAHSQICEALPEFREIYLPITNNLSK